MLAGDSHPDNAPLTVVQVTTPAHGTAHFDTLGNVYYAPAAGFAGTDTFSYTIDDPAGATATAMVSVNVQPAQLTTLQFSSATFNANETDPSATVNVSRGSGSAGAVSVVVSTNDGTAAAGADYTATTQTVNWADGDTADKTVTIPLLDDAASEATQTINLTLTNPLGGGVLGSQNTATLSITEDTALPTSSVGALPAIEASSRFAVNWSGSDTEGPGIATYDVFVSDDGGPFTAFQTATTATSATFSGVIGHTYGFYSVAIDMAGNHQTAPTAAQATTTISTTAPPIPTANPDTLVLGPGATLSGSGSTSVLANDTSADGQPQNLTATLVATTTSGSLLLHADGSFTYTPGPTFQGIDRFTYKVSEGQVSGGATAGNTVGVTLLSYHASLVDKLYHQVLHRSAEDSGMTFWTAQLDQGKALDVVATGIFNSTERLNPLVNQFYEQFLGRSAIADTQGLAFWVVDWQTKGDPRDVVENILASKEFFDDAGDTNAGYVQLLYQRVLQRQPEGQGLGYWIGLMTNPQPPSGLPETRVQIASQFYDTHEKHVDMVDFLFGEYFNGVSPLPSTAPYVADSDAGQTETQVEKAIIDSPDYDNNPPAPAAGVVGRALYPH